MTQTVTAALAAANPRAHHFAISCVDLELSKVFYTHLGFAVVAELDSREREVVICQMLGTDGFVLELFAFDANRGAAPVATEPGNDVHVVGAKHLCFTVDDLDAVHLTMADDGRTVTPIIAGKLGIRFFFTLDPNGIWVEFVHETRRHDPANPMILADER